MREAQESKRMRHYTLSVIHLRVFGALCALTAVTACAAVPRPTETHPFSPGAWSSEDGTIVVEIATDGTGEYRNLPRWEGEEFACTLADAEAQTGTFTWVYSEEWDKVWFAADSGTWNYEFEAGGVGGTDWNQLLFFVCMPDLPGWLLLDRTA
jgi:hypothetical protein